MKGEGVMKSKAFRILGGVLLGIFMAAGTLSFTAGNAYAGAVTLQGSGTKADPYKIGTKEEFLRFKDIVNGENGETQNKAACAVLTADIDMGGDTWANTDNTDAENKGIGIGNVGEDRYGVSYAYSGVFDGAGHTVKNLKIVYNVDAYYDQYTTANGLFAYTADTCIIKNLRSDISIDCNKYGPRGGIVAENNGTIENCMFGGTITETDYECNDSYSGGIAGKNSETGTIRNCFNLGNISGLVVSGGITGENRGNVLNCYNVGKIKHTGQNGNYGFAGGVIGSIGQNGTVVSHSYSLAGTVTGNRDYHTHEPDPVERVIGRNEYSQDKITDTKIISESAAKDKSTFQGWDFENVWAMTSNGPVLKIFPYDDEVNNDEIKKETLKKSVSDNLTVGSYVVTMSWNGFAEFDGRSHNAAGLDKDGKKSDKVKDSKSKVNDIGVTLTLNGVVLDPEDYKISTKNNKLASVSIDGITEIVKEEKKKPYFTVKLKLKGKEYKTLKDELKKKKFAIGIVPAELKQDQVDFGKKVKKDKTTGKIKIKKLTFTPSSTTEVKPKALKLKFNKKTEKTDFITSDNADGSVTVTGMRNYYGSVVYAEK